MKQGTMGWDGMGWEWAGKRFGFADMSLKERAFSGIGVTLSIDVIMVY